MAQEPATPKLRRAVLRAAAAIGGTALARRLAVTRSEHAALDLRAKDSRGTRAEQVTFLIPLVGPAHVGDWGFVCDRLQETLLSFLNQNNPHWRAIVCCQQRPEMPEDPRLSWLPFDDPTPGNDKWRKLDALCLALPDRDNQDGYVMSFDADDLLRQGTVDEMLRRQDPGGYLVQAGLVKDHSTGRIALAGAPTLSQPLRKPFWKLCGSCAALRLDPSRPEAVAFLRAMTAHEHRMFPFLAALSGRRLRPLSRPAVLYVLNHGENFGARRGRVGFKTRFVERFRIDDPKTLSEIAGDFPGAP